LVHKLKVDRKNFALVNGRNLYPLYIDDKYAGYFDESKGKVHIRKEFENSVSLATASAVVGLLGGIKQLKQKPPKPQKQYVPYPVRQKEKKKPVTVVRYY
jgi:hypothetical protein